MREKKYYEAYDLRYRTIHDMGESWANDVPTELVTEVILRFGISKKDSILELGCGEGRDAGRLLKKGYNVIASDVSEEAISYCRRTYPDFSNSFIVLDCVCGMLNERFDFIYAVAVLHMLVDDSDRRGFYGFIHNHLKDGGIALIMTMGDGEVELASDTSKAFESAVREHRGKSVSVAGTSCRMISFKTFEKELNDNGFLVLEEGCTEISSEFDRIMYAVVRKQ